MKTPRVTVLMPVYNTAAYLPEAIESILNQTFTDFEFLIIDDASTDGSAAIIESYQDPRIKFIRKPVNTGYTRSLNMGLEMASGEYIARMDSDDFSLPDRFAKQVTFMDTHPEVGVCGTLVEFIGAKEGIEKKETENNRIKNVLFRTNQFCHPSIFLRTSVLRDNNLYFDPNLEPAEDYAFWVKISRFSDLRNIPERLVKYRVHPHQVSSRWSKEQSAVFNYVRLEQVRELGIEYSDEEAELHLALLKGNLAVTAYNLVKAYNWITRLCQHNEQKKLFEAQLFKEDLYRDWERIVGNISDYDLALAGIAIYGKLPFFLTAADETKNCFPAQMFCKMEDQSLNIVQEGTVSVIIPCYNYGHFLREAIASVMRQSYPNWECIIIDDGSSDNTREVAGELCLQDSRIKYIHQANQGTAAARNAGLKHSKGQFIQFLDADDLIEKHKFVCQIQFLIANPHIDVVYSGARMFSGSMHERVFLPEAIQELNTSGRGLNIVKDFLNGKLPLMSSPIFRRSILEDVGLFIEQIKASEDYEFWLRCALTDKSFYFLSVNNTNTLIRKGHQSLSCNTYKMFIGTVLAHRALVDKTNGEYRDLLNKRQQELVRLYGEQLYKATVYVGFKKHGWELLRAAAIVKHPFLGKLVMAAALDKTKQLLSVAKKRLEVEKA